MYARIMLPVEALDYELPGELIARAPVEPRDSARLLVVSRSDPRVMRHMTVRDLPEVLLAGDLLVMNRSAVLPARFMGRRADTGGRVEGLYVRSQGDLWEVMLKAGSAVRPGLVVVLTGRDAGQAEYRLEIVERHDQTWLGRVTSPEGAAVDGPTVLTAVGATPLPPYILAARKQRSEEIDDEQDRRWYQTVFARSDRAGSVAAPTAGLHFTGPLLERLAARGVGRAEVVLHVGPGTFKPVSEAFVEQHPMHSETCAVPGRTLRALDETRARGGRVIAVGTTSVRTLESLPEGGGRLADEQELAWETDLLIAPGFGFRRVDGLMTNFHLPRSTLLALVGALFPDGVGRVLEIYREAIERRYRFFSYGDAMLILP
ncbi:MAG: tRNA preQ1(34) S-adenosylmethionine ribosyltransferase-isomerase QueA [Planctomycetota bacterium]|nr:tRNA preQ1(34) S-adenosylmethionine ribosyltransferase-isomerase QueA [Planctomycetota bacterium]